MERSHIVRFMRDILRRMIGTYSLSNCQVRYEQSCRVRVRYSVLVSVPTQSLGTGSRLWRDCCRPGGGLTTNVPAVFFDVFSSYAV